MYQMKFQRFYKMASSVPTGGRQTALTFMLTEITSLSALASAPILPHFIVFMAVSLLSSLHLPLTPLLIHCIVETSLSTFQLLCQIPPGARWIPVKASSS